MSAQHTLCSRAAWGELVQRMEAAFVGDAETCQALTQALAEKEAELRSAALALAQKEASLQQASGELSSSRTTVEGLRGEVAGLSAKLRVSEAELAERAKAVDALTRELVGKSDEIQAKSQALADKDAELQQASSELGGSRKKVEDLENRLADVSGKLRASEAEAAKRAEELEGQSQALAQRALQVGSLTRENAQKEAALQSAAVALAQKDASLQQTSGELSSSRTTVERLQGELAGLSAQLRASEAELAERAKAVDALTRELVGKTGEVLAKSQVLASKDAELQQASSELGGSQKMVEDLERRLAEVSRKLQASEAEATKWAEELEGQSQVLEHRAVLVDSLAMEKEKKEAELQEALGEVDRLRKLVEHLDGSATGAAARLPVGVLDSGRYIGTKPLDFYDAVLRISSLEDIYLPEEGWQVQVTQRTAFDFGAPWEGVRVIPIGQFNSGKTWLIAQLSGADLPKGVSVHTEGISMKEARADNLKIILLDTVGSNSPVEALPNGLKAGSASSGVETVLQELRVQEDFYRQVCFELGQVILFLVCQISHKDQMDLVRLARAIRKDRVRKDIVVVHNLREWDMAMLLQSSPKDGMSYVDRNKALFGLDDGSLDVTIGAETRRIIRHQGLFKGEGDSRDTPVTPVNVYHYYLTNHSLPCSCNKFAIQDMKATITRSDCVRKPLAEEIAAATTKVQSRFASFNMLEPQIVWVPEASCFRTKGPVPTGAYRMKPRDLGSYFTMGSDDPDYNVMLLPGKVQKTMGRRVKTVEVQQRQAYLVQIVLPGLAAGEGACSLAGSLKDIREQFQRKDNTGALRKEQIEGERGMEWVISFQATLMNIPDEFFNEMAEMTDSEVELSRVVSTHTVADAGSRNHFKDGARTVKVSLRTGIMDYDTSEDPLVTYRDGVLGITLIKQVRC